MINLIRTTSDNPDFVKLVKQLDAYLKITDGDEHEFYNQFNAIEALKNVVVTYKDGIPIGCGAFKHFDNNTVEIKRMYVIPESRIGGVGQQILTNLEDWAAFLGYTSCILETGKRQTEAVKFYRKCNYIEIEKYGQYKHMENSLCFKKEIG